MALRITIADSCLIAGIAIGVLLFVVTPSILCVSPFAGITPETQLFYSLLCIGSWAAFVALIMAGFLLLLARGPRISS